jgi:hypothetical protein
MVYHMANGLLSGGNGPTPYQKMLILLMMTLEGIALKVKVDLFGFYTSNIRRTTISDWSNISTYTHNERPWNSITRNSKIQELKRLMYKYPHPNPDGVIKCVTYFSINGDNTLLDEKLEQLRSIDASSKSTRQ